MTKWKAFADFNGKPNSRFGRQMDWVIGKWQPEEKVVMCRSGYHCCDTLRKAIQWINHNDRYAYIGIVEVQGKHRVQAKWDNRKECWSEMRVLEIYKIDIKKVVKKYKAFCKLFYAIVDDIVYNGIEKEMKLKLGKKKSLIRKYS